MRVVLDVCVPSIVVSTVDWRVGVKERITDLWVDPRDGTVRV
jgi:hypothetical protein